MNNNLSLFYSDLCCSNCNEVEKELTFEEVMSDFLSGFFTETRFMED